MVRRDGPRDLPGRGSPGIRAGEETAPSAPAEARTAATARSAGQADDAKAIAALVASFTKAFNAGDAAAAAATYAEDALIIDEQGERTEGRAAIRDRLAASFADSPGSTIAIKVDALRFLGPDTALEEGRTTITPAGAGAAPEVTRSPSSTSSTTAAGSSPPSATRPRTTSPPTTA